MKINRAVLAVAAVLVLAVVGAGTAVALSRGSSEPATPTQARLPAPTDDFSASIKAGLSATNGPATSVNPADVDILARERGAQPDGARLARQTRQGSIYLLPATDGFCLTSVSGLESGCYNSTAVSAASVICAPALPADTIEVFGVAPDGVESVTVKLADGTAVPTKVIGNVYVYQADTSEPRPLTVTSSAGEVPASVPADFRDGNCATPEDISKMRHVDPDAPSQIVTSP